MQEWSTNLVMNHWQFHVDGHGQLQYCVYIFKLMAMGTNVLLMHAQI